MLTAITYNCNPESLGDVSQEAFVDAFENAVTATPKWRNLAVSVTFLPATSEVSFSSDDSDADMMHEDELRDEFYWLAEKAFNSCLA